MADYEQKWYLALSQENVLLKSIIIVDIQKTLQYVLKTARSKHLYIYY